MVQSHVDRVCRKMQNELSIFVNNFPKFFSSDFHVYVLILPSGARSEIILRRSPVSLCCKFLSSFPA